MYELEDIPFTPVSGLQHNYRYSSSEWSFKLNANNKPKNQLLLSGALQHGSHRSSRGEDRNVEDLLSEIYIEISMYFHGVYPASGWISRYQSGGSRANLVEIPALIQSRRFKTRLRQNVTLWSQIHPKSLFVEITVS